jgi:retron-type reverse transcriptase
MGFSQEVSQLLTRLVTFKGHLAQGFPTSSSIANLILARIAPRIEKLCLDHNLRFSFYQDDLTVSGSNRVIDVKRLFSTILQQEGFKVNQQKLRIMKNTERQEVTGIVVNKKVNVSKDEYRNLRAILHQCQTIGLDAVAFNAVEQNKVPDKVKKVEGEKLPERFKQHVYGRILRVVEINPEKGKKLLAEYIHLFG